MKHRLSELCLLTEGGQVADPPPPAGFTAPRGREEKAVACHVHAGDRKLRLPRKTHARTVPVSESCERRPGRRLWRGRSDVSGETDCYAWR